MLSLVRVLHEAQARSALEIVLRAGQRPAIRTPAGTSELGDVLSDGELVDALAQVLAPDQQVELMVGNVVEFSVDGELGGWSLVTEPGSEGVVVRGRVREAEQLESDLHVPIELPPLEPFQPDQFASAGAPPRRNPRSTRYDLGVSYESPLDAMPPTPGMAQGVADAVEAPPANARVNPPMVVGATSMGMPTPAPVATPIALARTSGSGPRPAPVTSGGSAGGIVGGMSGAPTVAARAAGSSTSMPAVRPVPAAEDPPKHRTGPNAAARALAGLPEGSLCFVPVRDEVLDAVRSIAEVVEVVDDTTWPRWALATTSEVPLRVWFVVQLEDPSRALGFALRRVEEGSRVLLGTRTRTRAGARRMLLGTSTPALGQAWLDAVPRFALHEASSGWELVPD